MGDYEKITYSRNTRKCITTPETTTGLLKYFSRLSSQQGRAVFLLNLKMNKPARLVVTFSSNSGAPDTQKTYIFNNSKIKQLKNGPRS
jgi:hypothetical protein